MLLGADAIIEYIKQCDSARPGEFGNIVNYFKDSVYLHSRNLLNALTDKSTRGPTSIASPGYNDLKPPLERFVTHLQSDRNQIGISKSENIMSDRRHLNECTHDLAEEAKRCWEEWKDGTSDSGEKDKLQCYLNKAVKEAQDDCTKLKQLLKPLAS